MKREGRQHGMVRTYTVLPSRPHTRFINNLDSPPTAGMFTKVQLKPTGHSKFTGKCGRPRCNQCHLHPCCKSKDKTKGNQKLRSLDVVYNHRLVTWRVVDDLRGLNFSGFSATEILDRLANDFMDDGDAVDAVDYSIYDGEDNDEDEVLFMGSASGVGIQEVYENGEDKNDNGDNPNDHKSLCDVGLKWDQVEVDDGWCWVAEV